MFDDYALKLERLQEEIPQVFETAAGKGAVHFVNHAQKLTTNYEKVDTGNYRRNWEAVPIETNKNEWHVVCSNSVEYASLLEDGYEIKKAHFVPFDKMQGTTKSNSLMRDFKSKYPNAKGFIAKPRRFKGLKIGLQSMQELQKYVQTGLRNTIKKVFEQK
jgi:hypothetical protein